MLGRFVGVGRNGSWRGKLDGNFGSSVYAFGGLCRCGDTWFWEEMKFLFVDYIAYSSKARGSVVGAVCMHVFERVFVAG